MQRTKKNERKAHSEYARMLAPTQGSSMNIRGAHKRGSNYLLIFGLVWFGGGGLVHVSCSFVGRDTRKKKSVGTYKDVTRVRGSGIKVGLLKVIFDMFKDG